jgi:hypothetical protein
MTLPLELSEQVRLRANYACEYCGVSETDAGGLLTIDHFRPRSHSGTDDPANLIYCCHRCNLFKADYWPVKTDDAMLWNPRQESAATHLLLLADGRLHAITATGIFTIRRLRLNRPQLVEYRHRAQSRAEEIRLLLRYREVATTLEQLQQQYAELVEEHARLLQELGMLLELEASQ